MNGSTKRRLWLFAVIFALGTISLIGHGLFAKRSAPDVTFVSLRGEKITTASLRGKVSIVTFWATDCVPCREEMPELVQTYERYRHHGLEVLAVAMRHDPPNYVLRYVENEKLPFTVALDPLGDIARAFDDVKATPTLVLIGREGAVRETLQGRVDFAALNRSIERALAQ